MSDDFVPPPPPPPPRPSDDELATWIDDDSTLQAAEAADDEPSVDEDGVTGDSVANDDESTDDETTSDAAAATDVMDEDAPAKDGTSDDEGDGDDLDDDELDELREEIEFEDDDELPPQTFFERFRVVGPTFFKSAMLSLIVVGVLWGMYTSGIGPIKNWKSEHYNKSHAAIAIPIKAKGFVGMTNVGVSSDGTIVALNAKTGLLGTITVWDSASTKNIQGTSRTHHFAGLAVASDASAVTINKPRTIALIGTPPKREVGLKVVTFDEEPTALTLDSLDNLVVLLREPHGWGLVRYAGHGGERFASGSSYPASIASGYTNNTYMATFGQNQIGQVTPTGAVNYAWGLIPMTHPQGWDALGPNPLTWYPDAAAVAEAPDGSVYVSTSYALWHFSEQGTLIGDWLVADQAGHPLSVTSLAAAPEGDVIVTTKAGLARLKFPSAAS